MNNTYGTHVLLEACRMSNNIRRVINVSTDEVYGESSLGAEKGVSPTPHAAQQQANSRSVSAIAPDHLMHAVMQQYNVP